MIVFGKFVGKSCVASNVGKLQLARVDVDESRGVDRELRLHPDSLLGGRKAAPREVDRVRIAANFGDVEMQPGRPVELVEHGDLSEQDRFVHVSFHRLAAEDVKYHVDLGESGTGLRLRSRRTARLELPKRPLKTRGERVRRRRIVKTCIRRLVQRWRIGDRRYRAGAKQKRADPENEYRGNKSD